MLTATPFDRGVRAGLDQVFRVFGVTGTIRQVSASGNDPMTGRSTRTTSDFTVKCVITPVSGKERFAYDLAYIAAAKNFTMGGNFREERALVLIDTKTMSPSIIEIHGEHKFVLDSIEYSIVKDQQNIDRFQMITIVEGTKNNVS
jgi:hypothetical protein